MVAWVRQTIKRVMSGPASSPRDRHEANADNRLAPEAAPAGLLRSKHYRQVGATRASHILAVIFAAFTDEKYDTGWITRRSLATHRH
mgnify:CR=1 FL=1